MLLPQQCFKSCFYEIHGNFQWIQVWGGCLLRVRKQNVVWVRDHINCFLSSFLSTESSVVPHVKFLVWLFSWRESGWAVGLQLLCPVSSCFVKSLPVNKVKKVRLYNSSFLPNYLGSRHLFTVTCLEAKSSPHSRRLNWKTTDHKIRSFFGLVTCLIFPKKLKKLLGLLGLLGLFIFYVVIFLLNLWKLLQAGIHIIYTVWYWDSRERYYISKKKEKVGHLEKIRWGKSEHKLVELPQKFYFAKIPRVSLRHYSFHMPIILAFASIYSWPPMEAQTEKHSFELLPLSHFTNSVHAILGSDTCSQSSGGAVERSRPSERKELK